MGGRTHKVRPGLGGVPVRSLSLKVDEVTYNPFLKVLSSQQENSQIHLTAGRETQGSRGHKKQSPCLSGYVFNRLYYILIATGNPSSQRKKRSRYHGLERMLVPPFCWHVSAVGWGTASGCHYRITVWSSIGRIIFRCRHSIVLKVY